MADKELSVRLQVESSGAEKVTQLDRAIESVGDTGAETAAKATQLDRAIEAVGDASTETAAKTTQLAAAEDKSAVAALRTGTQHQKTADQVRDASQANDVLSASLKKITVALASIGLATGVADLVKSNIDLADSWAGMNARLALVTTGSKELAIAQNELFAIAQRSGAEIDSVASLYTKLAQALKEANVSQRDMLQLTETVTQSFRVSGATAQEASAATQQFGQALASGVLRGDEFNSMAEQSPRLMQAMADGMDVPVAALRKMAEAGELTTARITAALKSQADVIDDEFSRLPPTVGQATTRLANEWGRLLNEFNQTNHVTESIANGLGLVASHLDDLIALAKVAGVAVLAAFGTTALRAMVAFSAEMIVATKAAGGLGAALGKLPLRLAPTVAISVIGFEALVAAGEGIGTLAAKWSGVDEELQRAQTASRIATLNHLTDVELRIAALNRYNAVQIKTADQVARLHAEERAGYEQNLEGALSYQKALLAQAITQEQLGQKTEEAQNKARSAISVLNDAIKLAKTDATLFSQAIGADMAAGVALGAAQIISDFNRIITSGKDSGEALKEALGGSLNGLDVGRVGAFIEALGRLRDEGKISADEMEQQFSRALSKLDGQQLVAFQISAAAAFQGASNEAERMATVIDQVNRAALKNLGLDADLVLTGISNKASSAIGSFEALASSGMLTGDQLAQAFEAALAAADSEKAVEALRIRLEELGKQGELTKPQLEELFAKVKEQADEATKGINSLDEALKTFGIQTQAEAKAMADKFSEAWARIKNDGTVTLAQKQEAFIQYANAAIAANNGVADSLIQSQAEMLGLEIKADRTGRTIVSRMQDAARATGQVAGAAENAVLAMGEMGDAADRAADKAQGAADKMREASREGGRMGSRGSGDFERKAGALNYLGIINYLKSAGVNEQSAQQIAEEFVDDQGNVPYFSNPGQRKYGGTTITDALGKAAVQDRRRGGSTADSANANKQQASSNTAQPVVINIGGQSHQLNLADRSGVSTLETVLRELAQGKSRS